MRTRPSEASSHGGYDPTRFAHDSSVFDGSLRQSLRAVDVQLSRLVVTLVCV
jgi:hypothetical protein